MTRPIFFSLVALLFATLLTNAQDTAADVLADPALNLNRPADRAKAVAKIKTIEDARAAKTRAKAKALGLEMKIRKPDGGAQEIIDFDGDRPIYIETKNVSAAISTGANLLQTSPYGLNGTGIIAGVWDEGSVRSTHQEFANGSRITIMDGAAASNHGTHVGGTIGAQGTSATAKGMATNVSIASYDWNSDTSEMTSRGAAGPDQFDTKIYLSNHSYGGVHGWNGIQWVGNGTDQNAVDQSFGQYDSQSRSLDTLLYSTPYYNVFWAAGNDGSNNPSAGSSVVIGSSVVVYDPAIHPPGDGVYRNGFETIASEGIAKNVITIGATNDAVTSGTRDSSKATLTSFSSTGPADDGRIKPDLVANGAGLTSTASSGDTAYASMSGTSMATPNATGSTVLVIDQYKRLFNSAMRSSTLKALLIHTATDIGNTGPDYKYGWGLLDVKKAVDLIRDHHASPGKTRIIEDQVTTSSTSRTYSFLWDGGSPLRATVCWTDPAATAISTHDSRTSRLVNNLNLKLIAPDGTEYFPYVMPFVGTWTVASMSQNATTGINNTDNTETVHIQNPGQTGTWQAVVSYAGALTNNSQNYGLILSGTSDTPNMVNIISPNGGETFFRSSTYPISWVSNVSGNVSIELLKGGVLQSVISANEPNDGSFTWEVPNSLPAGSDYTIRISSVSNSSYTDTSADVFSITSNPWGDALDTTGIPWDSPGTTPWLAQTSVTKDGVDAVRSGTIDHNGSSILEASITGPGTLTFWWKVSSESNYDFLKFEVDGVEQTGSLAKISGNVDWVQKTVTIPAATTSLRWTYYKDNSVSSNSDAAWVDQVVWTPSAAPEIVVEQPVGTNLTDGSASVNFGSVFTGSSSSAYTFTIRNTGTADLTGLTLSKSGAHTADYTLGSLGATTLAPGASTTFTATFSPGAVGIRTAAIQIANNDSNENPFDINLTGTGAIVGTLDVTAGGLTSTGTYGGAFSPNSKVYTLTNIGSTSINWTVGKTQNWASLSSTGGTLAAGQSTNVTVSINTNANSLGVGSYNDTVTFTNSTNGNGTATRAVSLTVNPIAATVTLGNLTQNFDGSPKPVSVTTTPAGLSHSVTYNGSATVPSSGGNYAVVATITQPNYSGSASGTLSIAYRVNYNGNGNTGGNVPAEQQKIHGTDLTLASNSGGLFQSGFSFMGWNTAADGSGTSYAAGATYAANAALTLYARWTPGADGIWIQTAAGPFNWTDSANWSGSTIATGADRTASFTPNITANQTVNLDAATTIGNITFTDSTSASHDLTISGANTLTLSRSSGAPVIDVTQTGRTLTISGTIAGNNGLQKNGAGNLILSGTNNYTGTTTVSAGTLQVGSGANGSLTSTTGISIASGATLAIGRSSFTQATDLNGAVISGSGSINYTGGGTATLTAANTYTGVTSVGGGTNGTLEVTTLANGGVASGMGASTNAAANLVLSAYNAGALRYVGATNVSTDRLFTLGNGSGYAGGLESSGTGTVNFTNTGAVAFTTTNSSRIFALGGTNTGQNILNAQLINNGTGALAFIKSGAGSWVLANNSNSYTGTTTISAGTLNISKIEDYGTDSAIGKGTAGTAIALNGGILNYTGSGDDTNRLISLGGNSSILNNGTGALNFTATGNLNVPVANARTLSLGGTNGGTISGAIQNNNSAAAVSLTKTDSGTWQLGGINTYTGTTTVSGGELRILNGSSIYSTLNNDKANAVTIDSGGTLQFDNWSWAGSFGQLWYAKANIVINGGTLRYAGTTGNGSNNRSFTIGANGATLECSSIGQTWAVTSSGSYTTLASNGGTLTLTGAGNGRLEQIIPGSGGLTKSGSGTWTITGANTYTGTTTVSAGTLLINGSQTLATGNLSVAADATLGGTGTLGGNTTIAANGRLEFNLSTLAASHDKLEVVAGKTLVFSGASRLTITSSGGASVGVYTLISAPGGLTVTTLPTLVLPSGWVGTVSKVNNDLVLNLTTVPTPFQEWASASGLSGGSAALNANPDGDSLNNLQEYAFGMNPTSPSFGPLSYVAGGSATAGIPILENAGTVQSPAYRAVFARRKDHLQAGLTYQVEFSANLTYWQASSIGLSVLTGTSGADVDAVSIPFPSTVPLSAGGPEAAPKFFRVGVSGN